MNDNPNVQIRLFQDRDIVRLHEIREVAYRPVFQSFRELLGEEIAAISLATAEQEQGDYLDLICQPDSGKLVFVAETQSEIVGFCGVSLDEKSKIGEIDLNAVHPEWQGRGIGTMMYAHALDLMRKAGMKVAVVGTGGDASHAPARRAYAKAGFAAVIPNVNMYRQL